MSPADFTLPPLAAFFADCGLGSDPNSTGPCTGSYGPEHLGNAVTDTLGPGEVALFSVGAAILAMLGVLILLRMIRSAASSTPEPPESKLEADPEPFACAACDAPEVYSYLGGMPLCSDCYLAEVAASDAEAVLDRIKELGEGEALCIACSHVYWPTHDDDTCPICDGVSAEDVTPVAAPKPDGQAEDEGEAEAGSEPKALGFDGGKRECEVCGSLTDPDEYEDNGGSCNPCRFEFEVRTSRLGA